MEELESISGKYRLNLMIHFGSSAIGRANSESDMDIAARRSADAPRLTLDELCEIETELRRKISD